MFYHYEVSGTLPHGCGIGVIN